MNRRDFIQSILVNAGILASPKFIFDMGANLYKPNYDIEYISTHPLYVEVFQKIVKKHGLKLTKFYNL